MELKLDTHENRMQVLWWLKLGLSMEVTSIFCNDTWCSLPPESRTSWIRHLEREASIPERDEQRRMRLVPPAA